MRGLIVCRSPLPDAHPCVVWEWMARLREGGEPLLSASPFLGESKANASLSPVPKYQLQSGATMTSTSLSQLFNLCLSDQQ